MLAAKDIGNGFLALTGVHRMVATPSLVECMAAMEDPRLDQNWARKGHSPVNPHTWFPLFLPCDCVPV